MKKQALITITLLLVASSSFAASAKQNTGCGLGTVLWKNRADGSTMSQALQATTNASFGTQTFGITSGTLECDEPSHFANNERLKEFVVANMDNLAIDIAAGRGEFLNTFSELLRVPASQRSEFGVKLQNSFGTIFSHDKIAYAEMMDNVVAATAIR